jgi:hypothetical protein
MARQDWTYIQISKQMAEALDNFLKTDVAKKYSLSDKNQLVRYLVIRFLEKYQKEYGLLIYSYQSKCLRWSGSQIIMDRGPSNCSCGL